MLPDEELCIFYRHKLWFDPADATDRPEPCSEHMADLPDDPWSALPNVDEEDDKDEGPSELDVMFDNTDGDFYEVVSEEDLPFRRLKLTPEEEEEEEMNAVRRGRYSVVEAASRCDDVVQGTRGSSTCRIPDPPLQCSSTPHTR